MALNSRTSWVLCLVGIIAAGILSRIVRTGFVLLDKYLGDALYAAMIYAILRLFLARPALTASAAMAIVTAIELFQITMIPARLFASDQLWIRLGARLMGTHFSAADLLAYAVGIFCLWRIDAGSGNARDYRT